MNKPQKIVLADFCNEQEYHAIKDPHGTAFATLTLHREALREAVRQMMSQGHEVHIEFCDQAGYEEFCTLQNAMNTPQTVAAYVLMKHGGNQKKKQDGLEHQNITIHKGEKQNENLRN